MPEHTVNLASLDVIANILGAATIDLAANRESGTEDLKDGTLELLGKRTVLHDACDVENLIKSNGLGVLDVLLLLAVTRGLLEGLDDKGRGGGNNRDSGLTVLDGESDRDTETLLQISKTRVSNLRPRTESFDRAISYPVTSVLGNVFTNLLGRQTEGTDLGGQCRLGTDLTTSHTEVAIKKSQLWI